jgi:hypothetical protein
MGAPRRSRGPRLDPRRFGVAVLAASGVIGLEELLEDLLSTQFQIKGRDWLFL